MNIALDYDGTVTNDFSAWLDFIHRFQYSGHRVFLVTMRYPSEVSSIDRKILTAVDDVIYTSRQAKAKVCEAQGVKIHVWIDDHPQAVHKDAIEIWPEPTPEGQPVVPPVPHD